MVEETLCTAVAAEKLGTLAAALTKTKLVDALKGNGPFTGFAPTDEALTTALEALGVTAEELLVREDLADTVKYHVIPVAKIVSTDLDAGELKVGGLQGSELTVTVADDKATVNDVTRHSCGCRHQQWCDPHH